MSFVKVTQNSCSTRIIPPGKNNNAFCNYISGPSLLFISMKHSQKAQKELHNEEGKTYFLEESPPLLEYLQAGAKELSL